VAGLAQAATLSGTEGLARGKFECLSLICHRSGGF
jgi:hypothetical protein